MKTTFGPALVALLLLWVTPAAARAQFRYTTSNGTITITGFYSASAWAVSIPESIDGLPVTRIGDWALDECRNLFDVTIPDSVTSIGNGAFYGCPRLSNLVIGNSVTNIGDWAFHGCTKLTDFTIPDSVTSIGNGAFTGCPSLTAIQVAPSNPAFSSADGVLFDKNQTTLFTCPGGKSGAYNIPSSVTNIKDGAFTGCTRLTAIEVPASNSAFSSLDGVLFDKNQTTLITYPGGRSGAYNIPSGVTRIGYEAFTPCTNHLTGVVIPDSVTDIGQSAFYGCTSLASLVIPNGVTRIEGYGFYGCHSLTNLLIGNGATNIGNRAFMFCSGLASVTIPDSVTSIGEMAFFECKGLTNLIIGNSVTSIEGYAFSGCTGLTSVTIPARVTSIGGGAFSLCDNLRTITIPNSVTRIGESAFQACSCLTTITIPASVTSIGGFAFHACTGLRGTYFQGNAPTFGQLPWGYVGGIVYYLPGATGWGPTTIEEQRSALWTGPLITDTRTDANGNAIGFTISWAPNSPLVVEACPDLANPAWSPLSTNTPSSGTWEFSDPDAANHPSRFYRVRSP